MNIKEITDNLLKTNPIIQISSLVITFLTASFICGYIAFNLSITDGNNNMDSLKTAVGYGLTSLMLIISVVFLVSMVVVIMREEMQK